MRRRWRMVAAGCLLSLAAAASGAEPPAATATKPGAGRTADKQPAKPDPVAVMNQLEAIRTACDDVIIEFYDEELTLAQAKQKLSQLMSSWFDLYLQLRKGRKEVLGKHELKFLNETAVDRSPFIQRYSEHLLGNKQAVNDGELVLLDRIIDSVELYVAQRADGVAPSAPAAAPAPPSTATPAAAPASPPKITISAPAPPRTEEKAR